MGYEVFVVDSTGVQNMGGIFRIQRFWATSFAFERFKGYDTNK